MHLFVSIDAIRELWPWMLGWLLVGTFVPIASKLLLKHARQPYRAYLTATFALAVAWLAVKFWFRCIEYQETYVMGRMHIGPASRTLCFTLGVLAAFIGGAVVAAAQRVFRPRPTTSAD